jgi:hypothetical protein
VGAAKVGIRHLNHRAECDDLIQPNTRQATDRKSELEQFLAPTRTPVPYKPCGFLLALAGSTVSVSCTGVLAFAESAPCPGVIPLM